MKEGEKQIGSLSEWLGRRRRKKKGTIFNSSKQRRQRELRRKQAQGSRIVEGEPSWRLGCNIRPLVLESISEEVEAGDCKKRSRLVASAMEDLGNEQPLFTALSCCIYLHYIKISKD